MDVTLLFPAATLAAVKTKIAGFAAVGGLLLDAWQAGDPGEQFYEAIAQAIEAYTGNNAQAIRGRYLSTATDPGDPDPYNAANELLEPAAGFRQEMFPFLLGQAVLGGEPGMSQGQDDPLTGVARASLLELA